MSIRNFYVTTTVDGRKGPDASGPAGKDGGFHTRIDIRENGGVRGQAVHIVGLPTKDGQLLLQVWDGVHLVYTIQTER